MSISKIESMLSRLDYTPAQRAAVFWDFLVNVPEQRLKTMYGLMYTDLEDFVRQHVRDERIRRDKFIKSAIMETTDKGGYRIIIFETDYKGCSTVGDINESNSLNDLRTWFKERHADVRHIYIAGNGPVEAAEPFDALVALRRT